MYDFDDEFDNDEFDNGMNIVEYVAEKVTFFFDFIYAYCEFCVDHNMV